MERANESLFAAAAAAASGDYARAQELAAVLAGHTGSVADASRRGEDTSGKGLHSSTSLLNLSRFCH